MNPINFCVFGKISGKERPRFAKKVVYSPKSKNGLEDAIKFSFLQKCLRRDNHKQPVKVEIRCFFKMPRTWTEKKKIEMYGQPHTQTPDSDNVEKLVFDSLNKIAYADDSQIYDNRTIKRWTSEEEHMIISIYY